MISFIIYIVSIEINSNEKPETGELKFQDYLINNTIKSEEKMNNLNSTSSSSDISSRIYKCN